MTPEKVFEILKGSAECTIILRGDKKETRMRIRSLIRRDDGSWRVGGHLPEYEGSISVPISQIKED